MVTSCSPSLLRKEGNYHGDLGTRCRRDYTDSRELWFLRGREGREVHGLSMRLTLYLFYKANLATISLGLQASSGFSLPLV